MGRKQGSQKLSLGACSRGRSRASVVLESSPLGQKGPGLSTPASLSRSTVVTLEKGPWTKAGSAAEAFSAEVSSIPASAAGKPDCRGTGLCLPAPPRRMKRNSATAPTEAVLRSEVTSMASFGLVEKFG